MYAVVMREFGGPDVLRYEEAERPRPGPGEVLMRVRAVSVNRTLDLAVREGTYNQRPTLPHVLGVDPTGEIVEVGEGVDASRIGQHVSVVANARCGACSVCRAVPQAPCERSGILGVARPGGYTEYLVVPEGQLCPLPPKLPFPEATVITRHFPTAFFLLEQKAQLQPGERGVVMGAAGALGSCLVQVAKLDGARVIAAAGTDERAGSCLANGADFVVNYRAQNLAQEVMRITEGHGA